MPKAFRCVTRLDPLVAAARLVHALAGYSGPGSRWHQSGGTVYYVKSADLRHQLLPQRIERFDRFLELLAANTHVSTKGIGRLTPPWTYQLLAGLAVVMIAGELVTSLALARGWISLPAGYLG